MEYSTRISILTQEIHNKKEELKQYILNNHNEYILNYGIMMDLSRQISECKDEERKEKYREDFKKISDYCVEIKKSIERNYNL
jgi:hypothetical protein